MLFGVLLFLRMNLNSMHDSIYPEYSWKKEQFQMKLKSKTGPGSGTVLNSEQINSNGDDWRSPKAATK